MMAQYLAVKADYQHALLFYRMGDFYEMFFHDAEEAASALNLTLTKRGQLDGKDIPMCGVPVHAMDNYLARLIRQGYKVAICEQSEDPESFKKRGGKGPLPRAVVRLVTAGTLNEDGLLAPNQNNYLVAIGQAAGMMAIAWADMSTGLFQVQASMRDNLEAQIARLSPSEIVVSQTTNDEPLELFLKASAITLSRTDDADFDSQDASAKLQRFYGDLASDFSHLTRAMLSAAGGLLSYLEKTQISTMPRLSPLQLVHDDGLMEIDPATRRSLELTRTMTNERKGSLLAAIDMTQTASGGRLLAMRISSPVTNRAVIERRLDLAQSFLETEIMRDEIVQHLKPLGDSERCLARLSIGRGGPRDLVLLLKSFLIARDTSVVLKRQLAGAGTLGFSDDFISYLSGLADAIAAPVFLIEPLQAALAEEVPLLARDGGFIAKGYDAKLDELRGLRDESRRLIAGLQAQYSEKTGIQSLKIKHNNVLGYHIDVRANHAEMMMNDGAFIHRQTTAQTVRFTTTELAELERDISSAGDKANALELSLFADLTKLITDAADVIAQSSQSLAEIDVAISTAHCAIRYHYCRPQLRDDTSFTITAGRHPVVEQSLPADTSFMANDCQISDEKRLWLLTGPNMAGKSTFLRQNALIAILAQAGLYVPADDAQIGIIDKCFSRVGASDDLARGQSTFMVEMVETATILNRATAKSLVILDEIGRGTSTYDGLAIAHACLEYLHDTNGARTLFATHYHELTALEDRLSHLYSCAMLTKEWQNDIIFLHQVGAGAANRSYGVHVAKLAGLPQPVLQRAQSILEKLEETGHNGQKSAASALDNLPLFTAQPPARPASTHPAIAKLQSLRPDDLSAREALDLLYDLTELAAKEDD